MCVAPRRRQLAAGGTPSLGLNHSTAKGVAMTDQTPTHSGFTEDCTHPDCVALRLLEPEHKPADTVAYIERVQALHDAHKARCPICAEGDYCVVARQRQAALDELNG